MRMIPLLSDIDDFERSGLLLACAALLFISAIPPAQAQGTVGTETADLRPAPAWTGATGAVGTALGGDRNFYYAKLTIPVALGDYWTLGPTAAAYFQMERGEVARGNEQSDDRAAVGLELRRSIGTVTVSSEERRAGDDTDRVAFYLGARALYSFSQGAGDGLGGGLLGGVQYVPSRNVAIGLEASVLRVPDEFLFAPTATFTFDL